MVIHRQFFRQPPFRFADDFTLHVHHAAAIVSLGVRLIDAQAVFLRSPKLRKIRHLQREQFALLDVAHRQSAVFRRKHIIAVLHIMVIRRICAHQYIACVVNDSPFLFRKFHCCIATAEILRLRKLRRNHHFASRVAVADPPVFICHRNQPFADAGVIYICKLHSVRQRRFLPGFIQQIAFLNDIVFILRVNRRVALTEICTPIISPIAIGNHQLARVAAGIAPLSIVVIIRHGNQAAVRSPFAHERPLQPAVYPAGRVKKARSLVYFRFCTVIFHDNPNIAEIINQRIFRIFQQSNFTRPANKPLLVALLNPRIILFCEENRRLIKLRRNHPIPRLVDMPPQAVIALRAVQIPLRRRAAQQHQQAQQPAQQFLHAFSLLIPSSCTPIRPAG